MSKSIEQLRRDAKALKAAHDAGEQYAQVRVNNHRLRARGAELKHTDYLHVVAREQGFASWPHLKLAAETHGMDRAQKQQRLGLALAQGQSWVAERLLVETSDLADGNLGLLCGLFDFDAVLAHLAHDPKAATRIFGSAPPLVHLARSKHWQQNPDLAANGPKIADALVTHGADVNGSVRAGPDDDHRLSTLYFALGHAGNMALAEWLLAKGADPNDNESLYHATELGHVEGVRLLLAYNADPKGTNALLRAMDFDSLEMVQMLLDAGGLADEFNPEPVGGERPWVYPALHQAARRHCRSDMARLLLQAGADPERRHQGVTAYAMARVFGNAPVAKVLAAHGASTDLTREERLLAMAADGARAPGEYIDPNRLAPAYKDLMRTILHLPIANLTDHLDRLIALGIPYDAPDPEGLTPVQVAGWEGLPEVMGYLLRQSPDLSHINGYGGTLLSTILHGSENNPNAQGRDYLTCLELALREGVALPRRAPELAGVPELAEFLAEWANRHPGQVVDGGPA